MSDSEEIEANEHKVVGDRLREARLAIGLTQADTAGALGIGRSSVVALEAGTRKVSGLELRRLARLYRRSVAWLLGDEEPADIADVALNRATADLTDQDREQVLRFAQFLAAQPKRDAHVRTARSRPRPPGDI